MNTITHALPEKDLYLSNAEIKYYKAREALGTKVIIKYPNGERLSLIEYLNRINNAQRLKLRKKLDSASDYTNHIQNTLIDNLIKRVAGLLTLVNQKDERVSELEETILDYARQADFLDKVTAGYDDLVNVVTESNVEFAETILDYADENEDLRNRNHQLQRWLNATKEKLNYWHPEPKINPYAERIIYTNYLDNIVEEGN